VTAYLVDGATFFWRKRARVAFWRLGLLFFCFTSAPYTRCASGVSVRFHCQPPLTRVCFHAGPLFRSFFFDVPWGRRRRMFSLLIAPRRFLLTLSLTSLPPTFFFIRVFVICTHVKSPELFPARTPFPHDRPRQISFFFFFVRCTCRLGLIDPVCLILFFCFSRVGGVPTDSHSGPMPETQSTATARNFFSTLTFLFLVHFTHLF